MWGSCAKSPSDIGRKLTVKGTNFETLDAFSEVLTCAVGLDVDSVACSAISHGLLIAIIKVNEDG